MASEAIPSLDGYSTQSLHQFKAPAVHIFDDPVTPEGAGMESCTRVTL